VHQRVSTMTAPLLMPRSRASPAQLSADAMQRQAVLRRSEPCFASPPMALAKIKRSKSHHVHALFGASFKISISRNESQTRCLEVSVAFARRQKTVTIELRRLLFWFVFVALLCVPIPALKVTSTARLLASTGASKLIRGVQPLEGETVTRPMLEELSTAAIGQSPTILGLPSIEDSLAQPLAHLVLLAGTGVSNLIRGVEPTGDDAITRPVLEELSSAAIGQSPTILGLPSIEDSFTEPLARFAGKCNERLEAAQLRSATLRSCTSAMIHKLISSVIASDSVHHVAGTVMSSFQS